MRNWIKKKIKQRWGPLLSIRLTTPHLFFAFYIVDSLIVRAVVVCYFLRPHDIAPILLPLSQSQSPGGFSMFKPSPSAPCSLWQLTRWSIPLRVIDRLFEYHQLSISSIMNSIHCILACMYCQNRLVSVNSFFCCWYPLYQCLLPFW